MPDGPDRESADPPTSADPPGGTARAGDGQPGTPGIGTAPGGGTAPGDGLGSALLGLLRGAGPGEEGPHPEEVADAVWMAQLAGLGGLKREGKPFGGAGGGGEPRAAVPPSRGAADAAEEPPPSPREPRAEPAPAAVAAQPRVALHPLAAGGEGGVAGHVVRVAQPAALAGALDLARALRPLRQSVASPGRALLDEEATAQATGEAGRLTPVWRPADERRFSVDLVVDTGATMAVWHRLAAELGTVLERHGAFADVRCWSLDTDAEVPRLAPFRRRHGGRAPATAARWSGPLEDSTGRRILLVLTDGVGPGWYGTELPAFLARVAGERPAAALQVLPRRLWHRTALRTVPVELRVPDPARPVAKVRTSAALPGLPPGERPPGVRWLPVMEVDGDWLAPWAGLIAGRVPGWSPALAAPVRGVPRPQRAAAAATATPPSAAQRMTRFRAGCSPDAFDLACHLAAAPLSLPVMRLVQQATMPGSGPTDLAQLFLSGLIQRRGEPAPDPDEVVYDFVPGVRGELLAELTRTESLHILDEVLAKVSGRVAATFGGTLDFRALAALAEGGTTATDGGTDTEVPPPGRLLPEASLPFAEVAVAVLSGAGGQHKSLAARLAAAARGRGRQPEEPETGVPGPPRTPRPIPHPEYLKPVPPIAGPPDPYRMIGRADELTMLEQVLRPRQQDIRVLPPQPSTVTIKARPGLGRTRLVQEYVRRYGDRHSFIHRIDASDAGTYEAGLRALRAALSDGGRGTVGWEVLDGYEDWLIVLDDVAPGLRPPSGAAYLPPQTTGAVIITADSLDARAWVPDSVVLALAELTREEITAHLTALAGPGVLERTPGARQKIVELAARLPKIPEDLAEIDLRAELAREFGPPPDQGPTPLYEWPDAGGDRLAGYVHESRVWLASTGYGVPVRLWDSAGGTTERHYGTLSGSVRTLAVYPDSAGIPLLAVAQADGGVVVHEISSGARRFAIPPQGPLTVDVMTTFVSAHGQRILVTARRDSSVRLWDAATGTAIESPLTEHLAAVRAFTVFTADDGRRHTVIAHDEELWVQVRDTVTGEEIVSPLSVRLAGADALATVELPGRADLIAAIGRDATVRLWDTATGTLARALDTGTDHLVAVTAFAGPDGRPLLATTSADGRAQVWDVGALLEPTPPTLTRAERYALWIVSLFQPGGGATADLLDTLLHSNPDRSTWLTVEWQELLVQRRLEQLPTREIVVPARQLSALRGELSPAEAEEFRDVLSRALLILCPEATPDPWTWVAYDTMGPALYRLLLRLMDDPDASPANRMALLPMVLRFCRFRLLRGDPAEADALAEAAETWPLFPDVSAITGTDLRAWEDAWVELALLSIRARMACGRTQAALRSCRSLLSDPRRPWDMEADAPRSLPWAAAVEAEVWRDELDVREGRFSLRTLARTPVAAEPEAGADPGLVSRSWYQLTQRHIASGDLDWAARTLRTEDAWLAGLPPVEPGRTDEETTRLLMTMRHVYMDGLLHCVLDGLDGAGTPARERGTLQLLTDGWQRMWSPPLGTQQSFTDLANSVPTEYADLHIAFTELLVEGLLHQGAGPLWSTHRVERREDKIEEARALTAQLRPIREPTRESRPHLYARFLTAEGHTLLAARQLDAAEWVLSDAITITQSVYGRRSSLLPRLHLLLARACVLNSKQRLAEENVSDAERLLEDLHDHAQPHQDRVTALLARSHLAATRRARDQASQRAQTMSARLRTSAEEAQRAD